jgi:hypothetical protein
MNGIPGFPLNYLINKTPNLTAIPTKGLNYPLGDSIKITRGLRGYTRRVRSRAPSGKPNHPPSDSIRITQGFGGYYRGPNTRVPKEVELITIKH